MARLNHRNLALCLLAVGAVRHYGWQLADYAQRGMLSKGLGAVAILCLLCVVLYRWRDWRMLAVVCWWAYEELQVAICSAMYLHSPWPVRTGRPICSEAIGADLGALGILAVALICWLIAVRPDSTQKPRKV